MGLKLTLSEVQIRSSSLCKSSYALLCSACYMPRQYHPPQFEQSNNILREVQIMKPLIIQLLLEYSNQGGIISVGHVARIGEKCI
jgi:hypothetical protein